MVKNNKLIVDNRSNDFGQNLFKLKKVKNFPKFKKSRNYLKLFKSNKAICKILIYLTLTINIGITEYFIIKTRVIFVYLRQAFTKVIIL